MKPLLKRAMKEVNSPSPKTRLGGCLATILVLTLTASCATLEEVSLPRDFPAVQFDEDASELVVENGTNAEEMKKLMVEAMRETLEAAAPSDATFQNARFKGRAKVYATKSPVTGVLAVLPGMVIFAHMWAPVGWIEVDLTLEIDVEGVRYRGRGVAESEQRFMAGGSDQWLNRAAVYAAKRALADAAANGPAR